MVHLKPLREKGIIDPWVDSRINTGDKWKEEISNALQDARVAILLVSADFLASDFIITNELPVILSKAEKDGTRIIPLVLKPCRFLRDDKLSGFHAHNHGYPVGFMNEMEQEQAYDEISQAIEDLFKK